MTEDFLRGMHEIASYDVGRHVECDFCSEVLTDDPRSGGFLFGSRGVGPCCAEQRLTSIRGYGEEGYIRGFCPEGVAFADWIRGMREQSPQGSRVTIWGGP